MNVDGNQQVNLVLRFTHYDLFPFLLLQVGQLFSCIFATLELYYYCSDRCLAFIIYGNVIFTG